jgi:hypothetical protein
MSKTPKRKINAVDETPPKDDTKRRKVDSGSDVSDSDISDSDLSFLNKPPAVRSHHVVYTCRYLMESIYPALVNYPERVTR